MRAGLLDVFLVAETTQPVRCVNGMRIVPHYSFVTAPSIDILLIPGGVGTRVQAGRSADPAFAREVQKYIEYYPAPPYTHET
jgi:putative intracellular protease/amidase